MGAGSSFRRNGMPLLVTGAIGAGVLAYFTSANLVLRDSRGGRTNESDYERRLKERQDRRKPASLDEEYERMVGSRIDLDRWESKPIRKTVEEEDFNAAFDATTK